MQHPKVFHSMTQPYDSLFYFLRLKFEEDHKFAGIEIQAKLSYSNLHIVEINNAS